MEQATQILVVGGTLVLAFGFVLGVPMAMVRGRAPRAPRYLFAAHLAAIIQGGLLLALTIAMDFATLSPGVGAAVAGLLVGGVVLFDIGLTMNWLQGVEDAFAERSLGNKVSAIGTPLLLLGAGILVFGVVGAVV